MHVPILSLLKCSSQRHTAGTLQITTASIAALQLATQWKVLFRPMERA